jgi:hypothetical protein
MADVVVGAQILAGLETVTFGVAQAAAAAQIIEAEKDSVSGINVVAGNTAPLRRNVARHFAHSPKGAKPHGRYWDHNFNIEVKAATAANAPLEIGNLLQACGLTETIAANVIYDFDDNPEATNRKAVTMRLQELANGNQYVSPGSRFNVIFTQEIGERLKVNFVGNGRWTSVADTTITAVTAGDVNAGVPIVHMGDTNPFTWYGNTDLVIERWSLDLGVTVEPQPNLAATSVYGYYNPPILSFGDPVFTARVNVEDESFRSHWADYEGAVIGSAIIVLTDGTRTLTFNCRDLNPSGPAREVGVPNKYDLTATCHYDEDGGAGLTSPVSLVSA